MYDILIRGGDLVDGTGSARRRADVGIQGDRVVAIGDLAEEAAETIDATGKVVTPGFVDVHTHYDAQVFWDGALTPSPLHGVTTALAGNCGFTIAPLSDDAADGEYLMRMLARVEGMPLESLREGVPWNWTSTAEYFGEIEGRLGINAGFMVGHSAIRRVVMGEEATARESKPEELEAMQELLRAGLDAGALGFSSSWARTHNDAEGHMVPSRFATRDELVDLCSTLSEYEGTSLEFIPMVGPFEPWAVELMAAMSAGAQRPLNWNVLGVNARNLNEAEQKLEAGTYAREHGGRVVALTVPMSFPVYLSFRSGFVLDAMPGWEDVMGLPLDEKLKFFDDEEALAKLDERRPERRERAAHAGQLGEPQDPRRRGARERGVPGPHGRRDRGGGGPQRVGRAHLHRPRRRAQHQLRHRPRARHRRRLEGAHPRVARPRAPSSVRPTPAPTSTSWRRSTTPPRCWARRCGSASCSPWRRR